MLIYFLLVVAILLEVAGTLLLPATQNFSRIFPTVIIVAFSLGSFFLLTFVIKVLPISIVSATWSGLGVFTVAILGYFLFGQSLSWQAICGLFLIVIGVAIVNVFNSAHS